MLTTLLSFAFVLGLLIFVHELGHFVTAKMVGIRVERFSLGFPPRAFGKVIGDTDYCISWLPLGGYVKMAGMVDESLDSEITGADWEFQSKPIWQRIIVISAGSIMNVFTAILIFALLAFANGIPGSPTGALVSEVLPDSPAESVGMEQGDVITSIDGESVKTQDELIAIVNAKPDLEIPVEWQREGQPHSALITPRLDEETKVGLIGIRVTTQIEYENAGLLGSLAYGANYSYSVLKLILGSLKLIITGEQPFKEAIGGPIIIAKLASESAKLGWTALLSFTAFISLNLGFFNLLPFPVLDGGHLVFLGIEGIRRKPLSVKTKVTVQKIGMAFLLALMVFVIFNDIRRLKDIGSMFGF